MNSFWSNVSPLRFFQSAGPATDDDQATTDGVPGDVRVEPSAPAYETMAKSVNSEGSTPASFLYSNSFGSIIKSFESSGSPKSPVEEILDSNLLTERLRNLQLMEEIEDKQREIERKRSLHISQLQNPMDADMRDVLDQVASSTRLMAFSQRKAIEKDAGENFNLKGLETLQIFHFLSSFNKQSVSPAYYQVDKGLRKTLEMALGLPDGSTLESYYGEALGPDVAFIRDLRALVERREDNQPKDILQAYCMKDRSTLDRTSLMTMLSQSKEAFTANSRFFDEFSLAECKENIVANIRPMSFRRTIEAFSSRYMNPAFTFNSLVSLIVKELELELIAANRMSKHGVSSLSNAATVDSDFLGLSVTNSSAIIPPPVVYPPNPNMTCFNCAKKGALCH